MNMCEHVSHIKEELRPGGLCAVTPRPRSLSMVPLKNCFIIFITVKDLFSFHFIFLLTQTLRHRHAPTRLQLQLCNMQFHTQFTVTKRPWTHQMLPQCSPDRPEAGGVTHH